MFTYPDAALLLTSDRSWLPGSTRGPLSLDDAARLLRTEGLWTDADVGLALGTPSGEAADVSGRTLTKWVILARLGKAHRDEFLAAIDRVQPPGRSVVFEDLAVCLGGTSQSAVSRSEAFVMYRRTMAFDRGYILNLIARAIKRAGARPAQRLAGPPPAGSIGAPAH
jgi:hypothetical protein